MSKIAKAFPRAVVQAQAGFLKADSLGPETGPSAPNADPLRPEVQNKLKMQYASNWFIVFSEINIAQGNPDEETNRTRFVFCLAGGGGLPAHFDDN